MGADSISGDARTTAGILPSTSPSTTQHRALYTNFSRPRRRLDSRPEAGNGNEGGYLRSNSGSSNNTASSRHVNDQHSTTTRSSSSGSRSSVRSITAFYEPHDALPPLPDEARSRKLDQSTTSHQMASPGDAASQQWPTTTRMPSSTTASNNPTRNAPMPRGILKHTASSSYPSTSSNSSGGGNSGRSSNSSGKAPITIATIAVRPSESEFEEDRASHHTVSAAGDGLERDPHVGASQWQASDFDALSASLSAQDHARLVKKGINPALYLEMKAARNGGDAGRGDDARTSRARSRAFVGVLSGNAYVS